MKALKLEKFMELKSGENSHLKSNVLAVVDEKGNLKGPNVYSKHIDRGHQVREKGWVNIGDISCCLRTSLGLGELYKDSETPHIALASKHTRPVIIAAGKTQHEAFIKAMAGDLNSPFGGFIGLNTPLEYDTAEIINKMFIEGIVAPEYENGTIEMLTDISNVKAHANRFIIETGNITLSDLDVMPNLQLVSGGFFLEQDREPIFNARKETVVVTGNNGNTDINSLDNRLIEDINFGGNVAIYLSSNLVFFVYDKAIIGLGDGCGSRVDAARKARLKLEESVYAAVSRNDNEIWEKILYDTPFNKKDFEGIISPIGLLGFSDAFYPKLDGFVETTGIDRISTEIGWGRYEFKQKEEMVKFIPKKNNYDIDYDKNLIAYNIVQPGGCIGDNWTKPMAKEYGIKMIFTMTPETYKQRKETKKGTGRRFFSRHGLEN